MRNVINISIPPDLTRVISVAVRHGNYASTSEFIRHLVRTHQLAEELKQDRKKFDTGKGKILRSLYALK